MELVNLKPKIKAALRGVKALKDVSNVYPDGAPVLPMATFEEIVNVPGAEYDGRRICERNRVLHPDMGQRAGGHRAGRKAGSRSVDRHRRAAWAVPRRL